MNVYIYSAAVGGNLVAQGTTQNAGGMVANAFAVTVTQNAANLVHNTVYHLAVGGPNATRSPGTFVGVMGGVHSFAV